MVSNDGLVGGGVDNGEAVDATESVGLCECLAIADIKVGLEVGCSGENAEGSTRGEVVCDGTIEGWEDHTTQDLVVAVKKRDDDTVGASEVLIGAMVKYHSIDAAGTPQVELEPFLAALIEGVIEIRGFDPSGVTINRLLAGSTIVGCTSDASARSGDVGVASVVHLKLSEMEVPIILRCGEITIHNHVAYVGHGCCGSQSYDQSKSKYHTSHAVGLV